MACVNARHERAALSQLTIRLTLQPTVEVWVVCGVCVGVGGWVGGAGGGGGKDLGGRRGRQRTCPRCSNAASLNTHARTPRHASIAPEVPRKLLSSPRLVPNALALAASHLLNITSVSPIRMLAGVWAAVHARACAHLEATPTSSALQEQPRLKLEAQSSERADPSFSPEPWNVLADFLHPLQASR